MKTVILSRSTAIPSTRRLVDAARARGHRVRVLDPAQVQMHLDGRSANLYYRRKKLTHCDVVIPRIAQSISTYGLAVVNHFEMMGVPVLNPPTSIARSRATKAWYGASRQPVSKYISSSAPPPVSRSVP